MGRVVAFQSQYHSTYVRTATMFSRILTGLLLTTVLLLGCGGEDPSSVRSESPSNEGVLTASVRIADGEPNLFIADEVVASLTPSNRGRDLVIYARSYDLDETLALVIGMEHIPMNGGAIDLGRQGVLYLEPGLGIGGGDLLFDGAPVGVLEIEGVIAPDSVVSGRFSVMVPGYDTSRKGEELYATLEGTFVLTVLASSELR